MLALFFLFIQQMIYFYVILLTFLYAYAKIDEKEIIDFCDFKICKKGETQFTMQTNAAENNSQINTRLHESASSSLKGRRLSEKAIKNLIAKKGLQSPKLFIYSTTDSTNTRAKLYAESKNAVLPAVFIAEHQSAGRGRMGRRFDSENGGGIYISFLFTPKEDAEPAFITLRAATDVARVIQALSGFSPKIKWVNDLVSEKGKIAGILTEGKTDQNGRFEYAVCGIGINLYKRSFPPELSGIASTVFDASNTEIDINECAANLICEFFKDRSQDEILKDYRRNCSTLNKQITVNKLNGESFPAFAETITKRGELRVIKADGTPENLISAEVSVRENDKREDF